MPVPAPSIPFVPASFIPFMLLGRCGAGVLELGTGGPGLAQEPTPALPPSSSPLVDVPLCCQAQGAPSLPRTMYPIGRWSGPGSPWGIWVLGFSPSAPPNYGSEDESSLSCARGAGLLTCAWGRLAAAGTTWLLPEDASGVPGAWLSPGLGGKAEVPAPGPCESCTILLPVLLCGWCLLCHRNEGLEVVLQAGARSSTGGGRLGCLRPASLSGHGWHESMARLACSQPAGTAPWPSLDTTCVGWPWPAPSCSVPPGRGGTGS